MVGPVLNEQVKSGELFAFSNRRRTRLKILYWDGSGLWVLSKRLEKGTFAWPKPGDGMGGKLPLRAEALSMPGWASICAGPGCVRGMSANKEAKSLYGLYLGIYLACLKALKGLSKKRLLKENQELREENARLRQEIEWLRQKMDLLIRRVFTLRAEAARRPARSLFDGSGEWTGKVDASSLRRLTPGTNQEQGVMPAAGSDGLRTCRLLRSRSSTLLPKPGRKLHGPLQRNPRPSPGP